MRTFKHKSGLIATELNIPRLRRYALARKGYHYTLPAEIIEDTEDWQEVTKDEALLYKCLKCGNTGKLHLLDLGDCVNPGKQRCKCEKDYEILDVTLKHCNSTVEFWTWSAFLADVQKPKHKPILTSEDGVELFGMDKYYRYDTVDNQIAVGVINGECGLWRAVKDNAPRYKVFSTREKAEGYRLWNVQKVSIMDVINIRKKSQENRLKLSECIISYLEELVKSRLK